MTQNFNFSAIIEDAGGGGAYVTIPFDVEQAFGQKRVKVKATIDGEPYRGTLVRMGGPQHMLIVLKDIRQKIGKGFGDRVNVEIEEDTEPRQVVLPDDLQQALQANPRAQAFFNGLAYSHQREYLRWITDAKRQQTRLRRVQRTIEMLLQGKREH